jgi:hypothetical protein
MSVENYFAVTVNTSPFTFGKEKEIGCYSTESLANRVADFVRDAFHGQVNGGIDYNIISYKGQFMRTNAGLRLADTPNGKLTMIEESWNSQMVENLLNFVPFVIKRKEMENRLVTIPKGIVDQPKRICEDAYYGVVLTFEPFDESHKLYAGYYKTKEVANSVALFIVNLHGCNKVGSGFDMDIVSAGRYVEYDSGKSFVKVDGVDHEIKSSCESEEYLRLIKTVDESINKWSRSK